MLLPVSLPDIRRFTTFLMFSSIPAESAEKSRKVLKSEVSLRERRETILHFLPFSARFDGKVLNILPYSLPAPAGFTKE